MRLAMLFCIVGSSRSPNETSVLPQQGMQFSGPQLASPDSPGYSPISSERFLAILNALSDFGYGVGPFGDFVFQFDIRVNWPLFLLQQLQHFLDRRLSVAPRKVGAVCIAILQVQTDDLVVILFDHRNWRF